MDLRYLGNNAVILEDKENSYRQVFMYQRGYLAYLDMFDSFILWISKWNQIEVV